MADSGALELHAAVCCNDTEQLQALLESGNFNVNEKDNEWGYKTALHWAAQKGFVECAKQLIDFGANGTARMAYGATPAHVAAEAGRLLILKLFVKSKVSVARSDDFGDKPIDKAKAYGQKQCVEFLKQVEAETIERRKARAEKLAAERQAALKATSSKKGGSSKSSRQSLASASNLSSAEQLLLSAASSMGDVAVDFTAMAGFISDVDIDDDPVPREDKAYLKWMIENQKIIAQNQRHRQSKKDDAGLDSQPSTTRANPLARMQSISLNIAAKHRPSVQGHTNPLLQTV